MSKVSFTQAETVLRRLADLCRNLNKDSAVLIQGITESTQFRDYLIEMAETWPTYSAENLFDKISLNIRRSVIEIVTFRPSNQSWPIYIINEDGDLVPHDKTWVNYKTQNFPCVAMIKMENSRLAQGAVLVPVLFFLIQFDDQYRFDLLQLVRRKDEEKFFIWRAGCICETEEKLISCLESSLKNVSKFETFDS